MEYKNINEMKINCGCCGKVVYLTRDTTECPYCSESFDLADIRILLDSHVKDATEYNTNIDTSSKNPLVTILKWWCLGVPLGIILFILISMLSTLTY